MSTSQRHNGGAEIQIHSFFTSALAGSEWSTSHPGRFNPRKELRYPENRRQGGSRVGQDGFGKRENLLKLPKFDFPTIQPVARRYTDYAVPTPIKIRITIEIYKF
jgi:hypothetical protein